MGKHDPKSMLALTEVTPEEELEQILKEVQRAKEAREGIKSITYQNIQKNALKSYEDQQDVGALINEHREFVADALTNPETQALVLALNQPTIFDKPLPLLSEEERKREAAKRRLAKIKVIHATTQPEGESLKD
jgi:hypothetical protein